MDQDLRSQLVILSDRLARAAGLFGAMADDITKTLIRADQRSRSIAPSDSAANGDARRISET
jgi:hypothetical protein